MASQILENKDISHIQDLFLSLDKNGDGKLNRSDIITGFLQLGLVS